MQLQPSQRRGAGTSCAGSIEGSRQPAPMTVASMPQKPAKVQQPLSSTPNTSALGQRGSGGGGGRHTPLFANVPHVPRAASTQHGGGSVTPGTDSCGPAQMNAPHATAVPVVGRDGAGGPGGGVAGKTAGGGGEVGVVGGAIEGGAGGLLEGGLAEGAGAIDVIPAVGAGAIAPVPAAMVAIGLPIVCGAVVGLTPARGSRKDGSVDNAAPGSVWAWAQPPSSTTHAKPQRARNAFVRLRSALASDASI
jgi:hypothetical protein